LRNSSYKVKLAECYKVPYVETPSVPKDDESEDELQETVHNLDKPMVNDLHPHPSNSHTGTSPTMPPVLPDIPIAISNDVEPLNSDDSVNSKAATPARTRLYTRSRTASDVEETAHSTAQSTHETMQSQIIIDKADHEIARAEKAIRECNI